MSPCPLVSVKPCHEAPAKPAPNGTEKDEKGMNARRACGCVRTSEKVRNILKTFPQPPPPTPVPASCKNCKEIIHINSLGYTTPDRVMSNVHKAYVAGVPTLYMQDLVEMQNYGSKKQLNFATSVEKDSNGDDRPFWTIMKELISLIQLSVTATALAVYYIIYCYMQLIYYTLRSAVYFHQADTFMKITITIVTVTALIISFYCIMRIESLVGIHLRNVLHHI